ncbi:MAG: hypothetical protein ACYDH9_21840 [Limisphaerales bacterium]
MIEPIQRFVHVGGQTYRAFVYGRRIAQTTKTGIPLHGIALDGVLALHTSALRQLDSDETRDTAKSIVDLKPVAKQSVGATTPTLAEMEDRIYRFASVEQYQEAEARLEAADAGFGPEPRRPAAALLETSASKAGPSGAATGGAWTLGLKSVLVIRVDCPDLTGDPRARDGTVYTAEYVRNLADTNISPYYQESSYGLTSLTNTVTTQLYLGANFGDDPRTDFNPWYKNLLGWIPDTQVQTVTASGIYRINRFDNASGTGTLALKVVKDRTWSYWISIRRKFTTNASMQHGAYILWSDDLQQQSDLLDMTTPGNSPQDAALAVGDTFTDPVVQLSILPVAEGGLAPNEYLDVQITMRPVITIQLGNQAVAAGQSAVFTLAVFGGPGPAINGSGSRTEAGRGAISTTREPTPGRPLQR